MNLEKLPDIITVKQLADFFQIHIETVKRALQKGTLKGFKIGKEWRIERDAVLKWISEN